MPRSSEDRGEFRGIYVALIDDPDFQRLSPEARLVFLVLKLKLRQYGIDVFYPESLPRLTGLPPKACEAALAELQADPRQSPGKPLRSPFDAPSMGQSGPYSGPGGPWLIVEGTVFWIRNGMRFEPSNPLASENGRKGVLNHLRTLPKLRIVNDFARYYGLELPYPEGFFGDTLEIPFEPPSNPLRRGSPDTDHGSRMTDVSDANASSPDSAPPNPGKSGPSVEEQLWAVWMEELGGPPPHPKLNTGKRRTVLRLLYEEQLRHAEDPLAAFRAICQAVKRSEHHMSKREYQLPESLFRNPERRERWYLAAVNPQTRAAGAVPVEDIETLLDAGGTYLQFADTRYLGLERARKEHPDAWERVGDLFEQLDHAALLEARRRDGRELEKAIHAQLRRIGRAA